MFRFLKRLIVLLIIIAVLAVSQRDRIMSLIYPLDYEATIDKYSEEYGVDKYLVASIIKVESGFREGAVSNRGAIGLMQIMPKTGIWAGEKLGIDVVEEDLYDPDINIRIGTWYIGSLIEEFDGNLENALAAYNGGIGNVYKWLASPEYSRDGLTLDRIPFLETENYVKKVRENYESYKSIYGGNL